MTTVTDDTRTEHVQCQFCGKSAPASRTMCPSCRRKLRAIAGPPARGSHVTHSSSLTGATPSPEWATVRPSSPPPPPASPIPSPQPGWWLATDGNWYPPESQPGLPVDHPATHATPPNKKSTKVRTVMIVAAVALLLGVAGIAVGSKGAGSHLPIIGRTPQQSGTGYYNMDTLATNFTSSYNAMPGPTISNVTCILTGPEAASCIGILNDGASYGQHVQIDPAGDHWVSLN
jgi:hypothetical protein